MSSVGRIHECVLLHCSHMPNSRVLGCLGFDLLKQHLMLRAMHHSDRNQDDSSLLEKVHLRQNSGPAQRALRSDTSLSR